MPKPTIVPTPVSDENVLEIVRARRTIIDNRDAFDLEAKRIAAGLAAYLTSKGVKRLQLEDGSVLRLVEPEDRLVIDPVQLALLGVKAETIKAATVAQPVASYPMVDKAKGEHVAAPAPHEAFAVDDAGKDTPF